jgi:hypothetical protein
LGTADHALSRDFCLAMNGKVPLDNQDSGIGAANAGCLHLRASRPLAFAEQADSASMLVVGINSLHMWWVQIRGSMRRT